MEEEQQCVESSTALLRQGTVVFTWKPVFLVLKSSFFLIYEISEGKSFRTDPSSLIEAVFLDSNWKVDALRFFSITGKEEGFEISSSHPSPADRVSRMVFCLAQSEHWVVLISETINSSRTWIPTAADTSAQLRLTPHIDSTSRITVCSYNLNFALCDLENIGEEERLAEGTIRHTNADVVCLQETTQDWEFYLRTRLKAVYPFTHFDHSQLLVMDQKPLAGGIAVMSKYPISAVKIIPSPCKWFPAQIVIVSTPVGDCQILNLHLRPPLSANALPTPNAYFGSIEDRLLECLYYATFLQRQKPLIVCGDFNEGHSGKSVLFWKKFGLGSGLEQHDPLSITWWWDLPGGMKISRTYDHIFHSYHFRCHDCIVVNGGRSDHYPVLATFELID